MISVLLFGLIASVCAAPHFQYHQHGSFFPSYHMRGELNGEQLFDTSKFWGDISKELREIDEMLAEFTKHFPTTTTQEGVEGNEYKITIPLSGFEEKDIIVKAREGLLMIQANHKYSENSERNYLDIRTLPTTVNVNGTWIFEKSVLKIVFPLKEAVQTVESVSVLSADFTTRRPTFDREEIDENHGHVNEGSQDVDVGLSRGDQEQERERELMTNEIPDKNVVEATTYAVDLKDEVEFVPVRY